MVEICLYLSSYTGANTNGSNLDGYIYRTSQLVSDFAVDGIKGMNMHDRFFVIYSKGYKSFDFMYTVLYTNLLLKRGLRLQE